MKNGSKILNVFGLMIISTFIVGCTNDITNSSKDEIKIGVTLYRQDDAFVSSISENLEEIVKEYEVNSNTKTVIEFVDAKGSTTNQGNQVDKFINQEYDVICVNLVDRTAASSIIDKVKSANIPIIFFNREPVEEDMNRWDKVYYVGAQAEQSARLQADIVASEWFCNEGYYDKNKDGKIQYVILEGEPGHQDALIRTEYCIKSLNERGIELEKLADDSANWQGDQANSRMSQWINEFGNDIELVISNNDIMALGAIHAIRSNSNFITKPIIVGVDGIKEAFESIKSGDMNGTVISDAKIQAESIFEISIKVANGNSIEDIDGMEKGKYKKISHTKVTMDNIDNYLSE